MKPSLNLFVSARNLLLTGSAISFLFAHSADAATRTKVNNTDNLNLATSWSALVTSADIAQWTSTVLAANSTLLGADQSWQGISIVGPGGSVTFGGANTLTLGTSGIAMGTATQDLTISSNLLLGTGNQSWNVQTGRVLTLNTGTFSRTTGSTVNLPGVGTVSSSMTGLAANSAGIVGPWATVGTAAATQYGTFSGSNIVASTGTAAADGSALTDTAGLTNYDLAASGGTVPAVVSANTVRYLGAAGTTAPGATSFSVNGLMNVGAGTWTLGTGNLTIGTNKELVVNTAVSGIAISGVIQNNAGGSSALTKYGPGILTLSGVNNSYSGLTTVNSGVLDVGALANLSLGSGGLIFNGDAVLQGSGTFTRNFSGVATAAAGEISGFTGGFAAKGGPLIVNFGGASASVSLSGVTPKFGSNFILGSSTANDKVTVQNPINLNGAVRTITVNPGAGGDSAEFAGILSGTTPAGIDKKGTGLLLLSAANTYTGTTTVSAGMLAISNANALGTASPVAATTTSVTSTGSLQLTGGIVTDANEALTISGTGSTNVGALQAGTGGGTWTGPITLGAVSSRVGATAGNTLTITGTIAAGTTTGLSISGGSGTGVVILNPTTTNTYTGQTNLVRGILRLGKNDALPVTTVIDVKDGANAVDATVLDLASFNQTIAGLFDTGTPVNNVITNSVSSTTSTLTINNAAARAYDGFIEDGAGTVALVKGGTSTQTLNGANTYSGETTINVGALSITNSTALGNTTGATTIISTGTTTTGGRLTVSNNITCGENLVLSGNSEQTGGFNATVDSISGTNTLTGNITLSGTGGQRINATGTLDISGPIARDGTNAGALVLRTGSAVSTMNISNTIDLNGSGLNIQGLGTVVLSAASTDFTSANISFGGADLTLKLGVTDAIPVGADLIIGTSNTTVGSDQGKLDLAGFDQSVKGLTGVRSGGVTPADETMRKITNSAGTPSSFTIGNTTIAGNFSTFDGIIEDGSGGVSLTKTGDGTITLAGVNTYTGATLVSAGALRVTGSLAAGSAVTVGATGTLAGTGAVGGTVNASGTIAPGIASTGLLTTGATTLTGTLAVEVDGANSDKLLSTGAVNLSGPLTVTLLGGGFTQPSYVIAEGSSLTGTFSSVPPGYTVTYTSTQATLTQGAVDPYTTWINSPAFNTPALTTAQKLPTADPDFDGTPNFLEFALDGNPVSALSSGLIASLVQDASLPAGKELTLVCAVRDGAVFTGGTATVSGLTYTVEGSLNLAFPSSPVSTTGPSNTAPAATGLPDLTGTDWEYHTFKLDSSEGLTGKGFLRLKVTQP